ncbi:MAG TPA: hypothetical protein PK668_09420 [Myxococcota bacterium]|nr:hypothetical protein [Myxococcota bacterium]HRY92799.1 hypothetical protein [Myxococcota bacterium]HSA19825.1 hypothetical protein [Myxococcota bacterium]
MGFALAALSLGMQMVVGLGAGLRAEPAVDSHCLVVEVVRPTPERLAGLVRMLAADGLVPDLDGELLTVRLGPAELARVFRGRFVERRVAASAADRTVRATYAEGVRVPARYQGWIASVQVGHQVCE